MDCIGLAGCTASPFASLSLLGVAQRWGASWFVSDSEDASRLSAKEKASAEERHTQPPKDRLGRDKVSSPLGDASCAYAVSQRVDCPPASGRRRRAGVEVRRQTTKWRQQEWRRERGPTDERRGDKVEPGWQSTEWRGGTHPEEHADRERESVCEGERLARWRRLLVSLRPPCKQSA